MILSVLIPTLEKRKQYFDRITRLLKTQIDNNDYHKKVVIVSHHDNGKILIGKKRNELIERCNTEYCVFIDDDDLVDFNYLREIITIIERDKPDAIGFKGWLENIRNGRKNMFIHRCGEEYERRGTIYYRPVNHLNPMKTEFYRQVPFPELSKGEDYGQCLALKKSELVKNCAFIDKIMYHYLFNPNK